MKDGPLRTCVGCRQRRPKAELVRLVRSSEGVVTVDADGRRPGRRAYVCSDPACVERAVKGGRLGHAFRKPCEARVDLASMPVRR